MCNSDPNFGRLAREDAHEEVWAPAADLGPNKHDFRIHLLDLSLDGVVAHGVSLGGGDSTVAHGVSLGGGVQLSARRQEIM